MRNMQPKAGGRGTGFLAGAFVALLAISFLLILPGCRGPLGPPPGLDPDPAPVAGTLSLTVERLGARTILPQEGHTFNLSFVGTNGATRAPIENWDDDPISLDEGTWTLTVTAVVGDYPVASGYRTFDMPAHGAYDLRVQITPVFVGGGYFRWDVCNENLPGASLSVFVYEAAGWPGNVPIEYEEWYFTLELPAGQYIVRFHLSYGGDYTNLIEALHVYGGLTSVFDSLVIDGRYFLRSLLSMMVEYWTGVNFGGLGISYRHFIYVLGIQGVTSDNFSALLGRFRDILDNSDSWDRYAFPGDISYVKQLVDISLVDLAISGEADFISTRKWNNRQEVEDWISATAENTDLGPVNFAWGNAGGAVSHGDTLTLRIGPFSLQPIVFTGHTLGDFISLVGGMTAQGWRYNPIAVGVPVNIGGGQPLRNAGTPALAWIDVDGDIALSMTNRANNWDGLDLSIGELGFTANGVYQMRVTGTMATGAPRIQAVPGYAVVPTTLTWVEGTFTLTTGNLLSAAIPAIAFRVNSETVGVDGNITITGITFERVGEICDICEQYPCACGEAPYERLPGTPGNLNAVRAANVNNIAWDMRDLDDAALRTHFAGTANSRMVNFNHTVGGQTIVFSTDAGYGPGSGGTHDSQGHDWAALTILRPNMNLGLNYVLHITGRAGINGEALTVNPGQMGLFPDRTATMTLTDWGQPLPTPFTITHELTEAQATGTPNVEIRWNMNAPSLNPLPATFAISIDDMVIVRVVATPYEIARAALGAVINTANLHVELLTTPGTWGPFAAALAAARNAMSLYDVGAINTARGNLETTMAALQQVPTNASWQSVLDNFMATGGGHGTQPVTTSDAGITVHGRTVNHQGIGLDVAGMRALNPPDPDIVITGVIQGEGNFQVLREGGNWGEGPVGSYTSVTIDGTAPFVTGTAHRLITNPGASHFTVTRITVGGTCILVLLGAAPIPPASVNVTADGNATTVQAGTTLQFSAAVLPAAASQDVTWSIVPPVDGATISTNGLLDVASTVLANTPINVTATATSTSVSGFATVTVTPAQLATNSADITIGIRQFQDAASGVDLTGVPGTQVSLRNLPPSGLIISVDADGMTIGQVTWVYGGGRSTGNSLTLTASRLTLGTNSVTLIVEIGDNIYSRIITFRVTN